MEKPFTTEYKKTKELIEIADKRNLSVHENYMFMYHGQLEYIKTRMLDIGALRHIRTAFSFPMRAANDFRYVKSLGGGALLDCAGYPIKLISSMLGDDIRVDAARLQYIDGYEVDFFGSAVLSDKNLTAHISFGMDNSYKCELELQGSKGSIYTDRIFTAPDSYSPKIKISIDNNSEEIVLEPDNSFKKSIERFFNSVIDISCRKEICRGILKQAFIVDKIREMAE